MLYAVAKGKQKDVQSLSQNFIGNLIFVDIHEPGAPCMQLK